MLKINAGNGSGDFCDGIARRDFIRIGAMGIGGLTMANLLEAEARAGVAARRRRADRARAGAAAGTLRGWCDRQYRRS